MLYRLRTYKYDSQWCFDDEERGVEEEPFVRGTDRILDYLAANAVLPQLGFDLLVSAEPFPESMARFKHLDSVDGGELYEWDTPSNGDSLVGWLCSVFYKYFQEPPKYLYVGVESLYVKVSASTAVLKEGVKLKAKKFMLKK
jgi:hypothetical protein